jgi:GntR family transcriptional repressor for pyruvate dehydrogenase complex
LGGRLTAAADDFPPIDLPRAADAVTRSLIDGIRAGVAPVGELLPRDTELARHFGVSRLVVRDALDRLRRAGLIDVRSGPGGGAVVRSLSIPTGLLTSLDQPGADQIRSLLEARRAIETATAPLAATRADRTELADLAELVESLSASHDDPGSFIELDVRFHLRIAAMAKNEQLERFLGIVFRDLASVRTAYPIGYGSVKTAENYQLHTLEALRSGDPSQASASIDHHLRGLEDHFLHQETEVDARGARGGG